MKFSRLIACVELLFAWSRDWRVAKYYDRSELTWQLLFSGLGMPGRYALLARLASSADNVPQVLIHLRFLGMTL